MERPFISPRLQGMSRSQCGLSGLEASVLHAAFWQVSARHMVQMAREGFQKAGYEGAMWSRKDKDGDTILVATHVDDSIVTGSEDDNTDTFVHEILDRFDGTCERNLTEMLGME